MQYLFKIFLKRFCSIKLLILLLFMLFVVMPNFSEDLNESLHVDDFSPEDLEKALYITENIGKNAYINDIFFETSEGLNVSFLKIVYTDISTIIIPVYYRCPHMCSLILDNLIKLIQKEEKSGYHLGSDYKIVLFSINPSETSVDAKRKKDKYIEMLNPDIQELVKKNLFFLTSSSKNDIDKISDAIGFRYKKVKDDYIHSAIFVFADVQAKISRYLYDIRPSPLDYHVALLETMAGKVSSIKDHVLMFCFKYVPAKRKYVLVAWRVMTLLLGFCFSLFLLFMFFMWFKEISKKEKL